MQEMLFEELFSTTEGEVWKLSENAPPIISQSIEQAQTVVADSSLALDDIVVEAVGDRRRPSDYVGRICVINVTDATLFFVVKKSRFQLLSVGLTREGRLTGDEVSEVLSQFYSDAEISPDQMSKSHGKSTALRSIRQAHRILTANGESLDREISQMKALLEAPLENREDIYEQAETIELTLHNYLSSIWTFQETLDSCLKDLGRSREHKHYIQKYQDDVAVATGLRHCIQHRITLTLRWVACYDHEASQFTYSIGIPLADINHPELYKGKPKDAGGDRHSPTDYYYGDVDEKLIDVEKLCTDSISTSDRLYEDLKKELQADYDVDPINAKKKQILSSREFFQSDTDREFFYL